MTIECKVDFFIKNFFQEKRYCAVPRGITFFLSFSCLTFFLLFHQKLFHKKRYCAVPQGIAFFGGNGFSNAKRNFCSCCFCVLGQLWWEETKIFPNKQLIAAHVHQSWKMCYLKAGKCHGEYFFALQKWLKKKVGKRIFNFQGESLSRKYFLKVETRIMQLFVRHDTPLQFDKFKRTQ